MQMDPDKRVPKLSDIAAGLSSKVHIATRLCYLRIAFLKVFPDEVLHKARIYAD